MDIKVIGFRNIKFKAQDGNMIEGTQYFGTFPESHTTGFMTDKFFITPQKLHGQDIKVGDTVRVFYNRYGKIDAFEKV